MSLRLSYLMLHSYHQKITVAVSGEALNHSTGETKVGQSGSHNVTLPQKWNKDKRKKNGFFAIFKNKIYFYFLKLCMCWGSCPWGLLVHACECWCLQKPEAVAGVAGRVVSQPPSMVLVTEVWFSCKSSMCSQLPSHLSSPVSVLRASRKACSFITKKYFCFASIKCVTLFFYLACTILNKRIRKLRLLSVE